MLSLGKRHPWVDPSAFVADGVHLIGEVRVLARASVWFNAVLRADGGEIIIGEDTNVQDGSVLHADPDLPVVIGARVTIGHRTVAHGCRVEDDSLIGMGAIVLNGAVVGHGSLVAAGSVVQEGAVIAPDSLVAGVPARVKRPVTEAERDRIRGGARGYVARALRYREEWA